MLNIECLEHRLALSVAPITPAESVLVWSVNASAESPVRLFSLPTAAETARATHESVQVLATSVVNSPMPVIETAAGYRGETAAGYRGETAAGYQGAGVVNVAAFERVGKVIENVTVTSQQLPETIIGIERLEEFRIDRGGEPISVVVNRVLPDKIDAIEHIRILPMPHEIDFLPIDGVTILPIYDFKPGDNHGTEPGFWGRMPSFVVAPDTTAPTDGAAVAASTHIVSGEPHVRAGDQAIAGMPMNPFALALAGAAAGQVGKAPWLLPQVEISGEVASGDLPQCSQQADGSAAQNAASIVAPAVAAGAVELVANVETALAALGDISPQADLLASIDLGTEALDEALASVMGEVEELGGDLIAWFDDAGLNSWVRSAAALAAVGVGGAIALRWRAKRMHDEQDESESTTWLFHQLQSSTHA
jgi:hypothetical protein